MNATSGILLVAGIVIGLILVVHGIVGRLRLAPARCRACGYDIRESHWPENADARCPECGAMLAPAGAVTCARRERRPVISAIGVLLLLTICFGNSVRNYIKQANAKPPVPAAAVLRPPLPAPPPRPPKPPHAELEGYKAWEPLIKQLASGDIGRERADQLLSDAAEMLRAPSRDSHAYRAAGAERFIADAHKRGLVDRETLREFLGALFKWDGTLKTEMQVMRAGNWHDNHPISAYKLRLASRVFWDGSGHTFKQVVCLRAIYDKDGQQLRLWSDRDLRSDYDPSDLFSTANHIGYIEVCHSLPPGQHQLRLVFDVGAVPNDAHPRGMEGLWGVASKWPDPGKLWEFAYKCTVTIPEPPPPQTTVISIPQRRNRDAKTEGSGASKTNSVAR